MNPRGRLRACLELLRIPNLFTAPADVLAGFLCAGGAAGDWRTPAVLGLASLFLYGGGVVLNDVCDAAHDARERPERPIPSGRIPRGRALLLACVLLAVGCGVSWWHSVFAGVVASLLVAAVVLYDAVSKRTVAAVGLMGLCRALNLALGMSVAGAVSNWSLLLPVVLMWVYASSLTFFARGETREIPRGGLRIGAAGVCGSVLGLGALVFVFPDAHLGYLVPVAALVVFVGASGLGAASSARPEDVQQAVQRFVFSVILFDACIAFAARGLLAGLLVAGLLVPTVLLGRFFRAA
jgi:4-hydroxybenzoate polyprenyltransferase